MCIKGLKTIINDFQTKTCMIIDHILFTHRKVVPFIIYSDVDIIYAYMIDTNRREMHAGG